MKKVRLLKLELTNYRNIEHEVYVFDGNNAKIVGENRIGKTNTLEAIYFLLSNYLLDGSSDLSALKPLSDTTKEVRVEGEFEVEDETSSRCVRLAKTYKEKWVKQRGSETLSMQGHIETYSINGIDQTKEKDYYDNIEELFGIRNDEKGEVDKIQMLTNPLYLGNLGDGDTKQWQMLRTFIVKLIGDVNDEEIFAKAPQTLVVKQDLLNALGKTDQLKKMYSQDIDTLNNQLLGFDSQVELLEKTSKPSDDELEKAKSQVEEITGKISELKSNNGKDSVVEQLEKEVFALSKEIVEKNQIEFKAFMDKPSESKDNQAKINDLNEEINNLVDRLTELKIQKGNHESSIRTLTSKRDELVIKYKDYDSQIKDIDNAIVKECPTCHRPFDDSEVESRKKELLDHLQRELQKVVDEGKLAKASIDKHNEELKTIESEEAKINDELKSLREELNKLNALSFEKPIFVESKELQDLRAKEKVLKDKITERKEKVSESASDSYELVMKLESDRMVAQKVIDDRNYYDRQMELLVNVEKEKKVVSDKLISTEQKQEALRTYLYTKLRLLDEHIAKVFGKIKFALIKENINGGFDPICKPYIYDVDKDTSTNVLWKNGSKSEKIITGIAIVEAIRKELGLSELPFLFDEGGEISNDTLKTKFKTNAQIICVRVEDNIMKPIVVKF